MLVHGICGDETNWEAWKERLTQCKRDSWEVCISTSITDGAYFAGDELRRLGHMLSREVIGWTRSHLARSSKVTLHFICHSLGGLIVRVALPEICDSFEGETKLVLGQLLTLNTPHLGVHAANLLMCWKNWGLIVPESLFKQVHQVTLQDGVDADQPTTSPLSCITRRPNSPRPRTMLLEELADQNGRYSDCLRRFRHCTAVAATHWDVVVPFCTAGICIVNPFPAPNLLKGDLKSFWRVDAALGFQEGSSLFEKNQQANEFATELADSLLALGPRPESVATATAPAVDADTSFEQGENPQDSECSEAATAPSAPASASAGPTPKTARSAQSQSWISSSDKEVAFPAQMVEGLASAVPWRRIAYTLHQPWWGHGDVHLFAMGKDKKVRPWSIEFIDLLITMFLEDSASDEGRG